MLLWGLFLVGLIQEKREWRRLLLILAAALILVNQLALRYGGYFLPQPAASLLSGQWLGWLAALALAAYLLLHRERSFWEILALCAVWSAGAVALLGLISHLKGGHLARYLGGLLVQLGQGMFRETLYCLTMWLVLVCTALSAWELVRSIARTQSDARALVLKNQLVMENYSALEEKLRETARSRHESAHRLAVLDALVQQEDLAGLRRCIESWKQEAEKSQLRFCEQIAVNAILPRCRRPGGKTGHRLSCGGDSAKRPAHPRRGPLHPVDEPAGQRPGRSFPHPGGPGKGHLVPDESRRILSAGAL